MISLSRFTIRPSPAMMALYAKSIADIRSYREPASEAVDEIIRPRIEENFRSESAAGSRWVPLAEATRSDRGRRGYTRAHPILRRTDTLFRAATSKSIWTFRDNRAYVDPRKLTSLAAYALIHEEGLDLRIPQRSFLALTEGDVEAIEEKFADFLSRREIAAAAGLRWLTRGRIGR